MSGAPIAFAHRGARAVRRENTIEAFEYALVLGASGLESDVWLTSDGRAVLDHDGVTGPPWHRKPLAAQLREDLPGHIPSLEDLYRAAGAYFELSLAVKDPAAFDETGGVARDCGALERLWLCEPDVGRLRSWAGPAAPARLVNSTHLDDMKQGLAVRLDDLRDAGVAALNLHGSEWNAQRVEQTHQAGLLAFGWDAQKDEHMRRLVGLGLDGIYSDHVDRLVQVIETAR